jgi:hypothetical protein
MFEQLRFEQRLDDTSEGVVHETFDVHVNDDEDDEAYYDLAALGLKVPVVELYRNSKYRSDRTPPQLVLDSYGSPNEEKTGPAKHAQRIAFNKLVFGYDDSGRLKKSGFFSK